MFKKDMGIVRKSNLVQDLDPSACFKELVSAYLEYQKIAEVEQTKRSAIVAHEKVALSQIEQRSQIMKQFLTASFNERSQNFQSYFHLADQAIASGNNEQLAIVLDNIIELAKHSPFKDLNNIKHLEQSMTDPNHVWEF